MKWIGQHIYDLVSRFRDDVYLEGISLTTETNVLVMDSDGKVSYSRTLADDIIEAEIDTLAGLTSFGAAGATTNILAGDVTMYNAVNDGNPTLSIGSSATNRLETSVLYNSGAQTLDYVSFKTYTTSGTTNDGRFMFYVDEVLHTAMQDAGLSVYGNIACSADGAQLAALDTTTSSATEGGKLILLSDDGAAIASGHRLGVIEFQGAEDASNTRSIGARIEALAETTWDGEENNRASLLFYTTTAATESEVLKLDNNKLATFAGAVTVTGALTGTLATASQPNVTTLAGVTTLGATGVNTLISSDDVQMYNPVNNGNPTFSIGSSVAERFYIQSVYDSGAQTLAFVDFGTNLVDAAGGGGYFRFLVDNVVTTSIGDDGINLAANKGITIAGTDILTDSSGTATLSNIDALDATTLATINSKSRAYFEFKGYGTSDGTNYEMPELITDNKAPFEHDTSTGADGLTAQAVTTVIRQGGVVMPYTGVLKKFTGWVASAGTGTVDIGIFKFTPVDNDSSTVTPVLLVNEQITAAGNAKVRSFSETSSFDAGFTAGDIIYSAVLGGTDNKSWYLNSMLEVEWS